jgi:hypothetical protein
LESDIWEFYKELLSHFNFHLDKTILITILHEDLQAFQCPLLYIIHKNTYEAIGTNYNTFGDKIPVAVASASVSINLVFQILGDDRHVSRSCFIVHICPSPIKQMTTLMHIPLVHGTFPHTLTSWWWI